MIALRSRLARHRASHNAPSAHARKNQHSPKGRRKSCKIFRVATYDGPGAQPVIRTVPWPKIPKKAALIKVGACGVCGTDLHILKGHWPKPLPWPFTLGHEIGGVLVEVGSEFTEDFMSKPLDGGLEGDDPAADAVRQLLLLHPLSRERQQVPDAGLLRPLSRLRQGAASVGRLGRICLCRSRHVAGHQDLQTARRHVAAARRAVGAIDLLHPRFQPRHPRRRIYAGATPL